MSNTFKKIENTSGNHMRLLSFCQYYGGERNGSMIQLTQGLGSKINDYEPGFIQLTAIDAYKVIGVLAEWLKERSANEAARIEEMIKKDKELQNTILKDAIECEHFIADLKVLEIPLRLLG